MLTTMHVAHADLLGLPREAFEVDVDFGLESDPRREANFDRSDAWLRQAASALAENGITVDMADTHIDPSRLDRYPAVYLQSVDFMDPLDQAALLGYVEDGGTLVIGPTMPTRDPNMRQTEVIARFLDAPGRTEMGNGELIWADNDSLSGIVDDLSPLSPIRLESGPGDLAVFRRGEQTLIFVANPTGCAIVAIVLSDGDYVFETIWGPEEVRSSRGKLAIELPPYTIRIFDVTGCSQAAKGAKA
jgi:beta-galactosidase